jgi:transposase-like protein
MKMNGVKKRRQFTGEFKARVALAALKGERSSNELASVYEVHPTQVTLWKKQLAEGAREFFADHRQQENWEWERQRDDLYRQIGQMKVEMDWLKKRLEP